VGTFSATTSADAVVPFERQRIWDALVDPDLVARLTPFVRGIDDRDEHWLWRLREICVDLPAPGAAGPAVRSAMKGVMATMGQRFSRNLIAHLEKT
jgi:hypothetical protein